MLAREVTYVCIDKSILVRAVWIFLQVTVHMVSSVHSSPPQWTYDKQLHIQRLGRGSTEAADAVAVAEAWAEKEQTQRQW